MSELLVNTIKKADGTGSLTVPAESGTVVTTASPSLGRRNLIINGAMQVAQRGTSFTGLTNGSSGYTLDRWEWRESSTTSSVWTVSQDTDTPNGFGYSIKATATTGASTASGNLNRFRQSIEAQNLQGLAHGTSDAKQLTISFYVKSNKTGTANVTLYAPDSDDLYAANYTIDTADTWEYKTITYSANTSGSINNDNGVGFYVDFIYAAGSTYTSGTGGSWANYASPNYAPGQTLEVGTATNDYFQITGVQLEVGSVATPFEHRSYGEELALCQRYYQKYELHHGYNLTGSFYSTNPDGFKIDLKVEMRASPSVTFPTIGTSLGTIGFIGTNGSYMATQGTVTARSTTSKIGWFGSSFSGSNTADGMACMVYSNTSGIANNVIKIDAEL